MPAFIEFSLKLWLRMEKEDKNCHCIKSKLSILFYIFVFRFSIFSFFSTEINLLKFLNFLSYGRTCFFFVVFFFSTSVKTISGSLGSLLRQAPWTFMFFFCFFFSLTQENKKFMEKKNRKKLLQRKENNESFLYYLTFFKLFLSITVQ